MRDNIFFKTVDEQESANTLTNVEKVMKLSRRHDESLVTNCSGEHSVTKMKFIKNTLRTTMCYERLSHMA